MFAPEVKTADRFPKVDRAAWRRAAENDLGGASFERRLVSRTYDGLEVQPLYDEGHRAGVPGSGWSGLMPMTRGARAAGTAWRGWELRQERAECDPARANACVREDLEGGVDSLVIRLDACARAGLDPTDPGGAALAARDGVCVSDADGLDRVLEGAHLGMIEVSLESGAAFVAAAGVLAALWERRGVTPEAARGAFQADPLAVLAREGQLAMPLGEALRDMAALARWTASRYPNVRAVRVGTAAYHHAGATSAQDLAFSMATALEYLRAMTGAGMSVDEASGQVLFGYAVGTQVFLGIAKLRAARRLWARVVEACGGSIEARRMCAYVRPSRRVMTTRDPWVNVLRNTACVAAAGLGGADAVMSAAFDAPLGEPSELGRRLARNTGHVLMEECGLHRVCDAVGGSYYVESLTDDLCDKAWALLREIEGRGGMAASLRDGWVGAAIDRVRAKREESISTRREVIVGVSDFPELSGRGVEPAPVDREGVVRRAQERLARGVAPMPVGANRVEWALDAARRGAAIGSMFAGLYASRSGETIPRAVSVHPYAEAFERLRDASDEHLRQCGVRPVVSLVVLGSSAKRLARENYCRNLFEAGGFEVIGGEPAAAEGTAETALASFQRFPAAVAVICGPDESYGVGVPVVAPGLHRLGARRVVLAGNPGAQERAFRDAGVDTFVFVRCDVVSVLRDLLFEEGVRA